MSRKRLRAFRNTDAGQGNRRRYTLQQLAVPPLLLGFIVLQLLWGVSMSSASGKKPAGQPASPAAEGPYDLPTGPGPPPRYSDDQLNRMAYDRAVEDGSSAALVMFLARNPDSPYANRARQRLSSRHRADSQAVVRRVAGADANVVAAFDKARLSGDPGQIRAFIARHGSHPLAQEAMRLLQP